MGDLIVLGLPGEDVLFLRDMLADCAASATREHKRANARRILAEIERQERTCRKEMRNSA